MNTELDIASVEYRGLYRTRRIPPCVVSVEDLRRLYSELSQKSREALQRHLAGLERPADVSPENFESLKRRAGELGTLTVTVLGGHGEQIISGSSDGLQDTNMPDKITSITFDNWTATQRFNVTSPNRFTVRLDFTEPPGFNMYNPWEQPTPNSSNLEVTGDDSTWVTAVFESTLSFFRHRRRSRGWLHSHVAFNALNWLVGFPGALWGIYRIDTAHAAVLSSMHGALRGALYVYLFLMALLVFRFIVWGFRWSFPVVELEGARSKKTRGLASAALGSLLLALVYDVLRALIF